jgi:hypothetical protein
MKASDQHRLLTYIKSLTVLLYLIAFSQPSLSNAFTDAMIKMETSHMKWLEKEQLQLTNLISFVSDGCSGGMSGGWRFLAKQLPEFGKKYGNNPPWESCCIDHDRVYWLGVTKNGYAIREQADLVLKRCVIESGQKMIGSKTDKKKKHEIEQIFAGTAEMMYQAVRIGGKPCSVLPWRWGYGWPQCTVRLSEE